MLKKASYIIISLLLLIATTGFTSFNHYCGEVLISGFVLEDHENCCEDASTCCHEEAESFRVDEDYTFSSFDYDFGQIAVKMLILPGFTGMALSHSTMPFKFTEGPPPPDTKTVLSSLQVFIL